MPGPLAGVKVIDLTAVLLGPFATQHLADMGADVIKVEPPEGDLLRLSGGSMGRDKSMGPIYMAANRNKRSLSLDLKKPKAVEILKGLIKGADLFIHNSRPAAIERLGLGYEDLKKVNPSIIYAYSLGYARKGPYGHKPAFDDLVQGVSGAASLQSRVDGESPKFMPSLIADKTTGLHLCIAVLGALYHRKCTGEGQLIEVPMLETLASFWLTEHLFGETWTPGRGTMGYDRIINKFRHPFPTKDGYICALPYTDAHWVRFFEIVERPDLAKDPRFCDRTVRPKHFSELYQVLDSLMQHRKTQEWLDALDEADIPAMPVNTLEELLEDPHLKATGFFADREHPTEGPIKTFKSPLDFEKTPVEFRRHAPRIGEDGPEVLREAGLSDADIATLKADKTLIVPS
ncbi:MAG: CoA transferase [Reyranella sp.]|uniref:CaiB/BaiF CoA transferase family protein n=1 Tax=Reyranella sp. TaxID=1929291 RepID=UPI001AD411F6|nr:CoA transferase [Reyranella sp.]MBN9089995.1 CoA transferase [Reyranella sp.]